MRFDPLSQAMERQRGAKPNCRVLQREIHAELCDAHACQFGLTSVMCQLKLTQQIATPECPQAAGYGRTQSRRAEFAAARAMVTCTVLVISGLIWQ
jgi:hypothetical protein